MPSVEDSILLRDVVEVMPQLRNRSGMLGGCVSCPPSFHLLAGVVVRWLGHHRWYVEIETWAAAWAIAPTPSPFAFHGFCGAIGPFRQAHAR